VIRYVCRLAVVAMLLCIVPLATAECTVSGINLVFGSYDPFRLAPTDSTGNIAVTCSGEAGMKVGYGISLNAGNAGSFAPRQMRLTGSNATLGYNLYLDPARSQIWGDGNAGTFPKVDGYALTGLSSTRNYPVYGRIPARQNVLIGPYLDTIMITLLF
jgi:spore coat protein U-like protein